jgi:hypothetical protein
MNGSGEFNPDIWHGIREIWRFWYDNGRKNHMNHYQALVFASEQTTAKVQHACSLFVDATKNFGTEDK